MPDSQAASSSRASAGLSITKPSSVLSCRRSRIEVERADEDARAVDGEGLRVQARAGAAAPARRCCPARIRRQPPQLEERDAGLEQRLAPLRVAGVHDGDVGGLERVGQDADLHAARGQRDERSRRPRRSARSTPTRGRAVGAGSPMILRSCSGQSSLRGAARPRPFAGSSLTMRVGAHSSGSLPVDQLADERATRAGRSCKPRPRDRVRPASPPSTSSRDLRRAGRAAGSGRPDTKSRSPSTGRSPPRPPSTTGPTASTSRSTKSDAVRRAEVLVADVAPADDRRLAVGGERLVVHAAVRPGEVGQVTEPRGARITNGLKSRTSMSRVRIERGERRVEAGGVVVVEQQPHAHAAVGRRAQRSSNSSVPDHVLVPDVVLDVERAFGGLGQPHARRERVARVGQRIHAGQPGMRRHERAIARPSRLSPVSNWAVEELRFSSEGKALHRSSRMRPTLIVRRPSTTRLRDVDRAETAELATRFRRGSDPTPRICSRIKTYCAEDLL